MKTIMKRNTRTIAALFTLALLFVMAGCSKKTYASLEEWYNDNPVTAAIVNSAISSSTDSGNVSMDIKGNTITYHIEMDEAIFGLDPEMDAIYKSTLDQAFSQDEESIKDFIDETADAAGIDASLIIVTYAAYNPGEDTPGYSISFKK